MKTLRDCVPSRALGASIRGTTLAEVARDVVAIARAGLVARNRLNGDGQDESVFLGPLDEVVAKKETLAEEMLAAWHTRWNRSVEPVFEAYQY